MKKVRFYLIVTLLLCGVASAFAQDITIRGIVTDSSNGESVPMASVIELNTTNGVVAGIDGYYSITVGRNATILVSSIGYKTKEVRIVGDNTVVNVSLDPDEEFLDEVFVVAYGTAKKSSYSGSAEVVKSDELVRTPVASVEQALQGKVAGLQVTSSSGQPGAATSFRIRGTGSLNASSEPLYVVDGVAMTNTSYSYIADYNYSSASIVSSINPQDIESITVLKDAAAASLYGSRAANGVVIITTKSGKAGQGKVNFNAQVGIATVPTKYDVMNSTDYYRTVFNSYVANAPEDETDPVAWANEQTQGLLTWNPFNVAQPMDASGNVVSGAKNIIDTDWQDAVMKPGVTQDYSLSYTGGNDKISYFFSGGYFDQKGMTPTSRFTRYSGKTSVDAKIKEWLSAGANVIASYTKQNTESASSSGSSPLFNALQFPNAVPVYVVDNAGKPVLDEEGQKQYNWINPASKDFNPLATPYMDPNNTDTYRFFASLYTEVKIIEGLKLKTVFSPDIVSLYEGMYWNKYHGNGPAYNGRGQKNYTSDRMYTSTTTINYSNTFKDNHGFSAMAGYEVWKSKRDLFRGAATNYTFDFMQELVGASSLQEMTSYSTESSLMSAFGHAEYNYAEKYFVSGSFRRDGSSVFGADRKWGNFFSLGASWRLIKEDFAKDIDWLSDLKIRASYGTSGNNEGIGRYQSLGLWYADAMYLYGNNAGLGHEQFANPELGWEKQKMLNIGVDFGVLDNRITGSLEYFRKVSDDLLYQYPLPASHGVGYAGDMICSVMMNLAKVQNQGVEFLVNASPVVSKDFNWDISFNFSYNADKILDLAGDDDLVMSDTKKIWKVGRSQYEFYMPTWAGVDSKNGDPLWKAGDGVTNDYNVADYDFQGRATPWGFGSLTNNISWKNFNFSFMFYYNLGGKFYDTLYAGLMHDGNDSGKNLSADATRAWTPTNTSTDVPCYKNSNDNQSNSPSTRFLYDATYLKLKNINLSYSLPERVLAKTNGAISAVKVFANIDNLFTVFADKDYRGYDDIDLFGVGGYDAYPYYIPVSRTYTFGLNITF